MGLPVGFNANLHPELSDAEFIEISTKTFFGWDDAEYDSWTAQNGGANLRYANQCIATGGRPAWYAALSTNIGCNDTDGWFYNLPPWTWMVVVPIVAITGGILLWRAWGKGFYESSIGNGSGHGL